MHFAENVLTRLGRPDLIALCKPRQGRTRIRSGSSSLKHSKSKTQAEWIVFFADVDAAFAPVQTMREAVDDPQVRSRDMVLVDERGWEHIGVPIKFRDEPGQPEFDLPDVGQHTEEILREAGYDDAGVIALRNAGVF